MKTMVKRPNRPKKSIVKVGTKSQQTRSKVGSKSTHPASRKSPARRKSSGKLARPGPILDASENVCACGLPLVMASGPETAKIGVIGEYPGEVELRTRVPFTGPTGDVFWSEWKRAGLPYARVTNVWQHMPTEDASDADINLRRAIAQVAKCKIILLLGGTATQAFLDTNIMSISGLWTTSPLLGKRPVIAAPNPAVALRSTVGELRLTLERLSKRKELR